MTAGAAVAAIPAAASRARALPLGQPVRCVELLAEPADLPYVADMAEHTRTTVPNPVARRRA